MKKFTVTSLFLTVGLACGLGLYVSNQKPKFWCNKQWAGVALTKGGYRSWSISFCDGEAYIDGKLKPVVFAPDVGYRIGYHRWPEFKHTDLRGIRIGTNGAVYVD